MALVRCGLLGALTAGVLLDARLAIAQSDSTRAAAAARVEITVVVEGTDAALSNAVIESAALHTQWLTNAQGHATLTAVAPGRNRVAIRHIGYSPRDTMLEFGTDGAAVRIGLRHLAVQLAGLTARAQGACTHTGLPDRNDSTSGALGAVMQQVAQNAAQQRLIVDQYPYTYTYERTTEPLGVDPETVRFRVDTLQANGAQAWVYEPGRVYQLVPPVRGTTWRTVMHTPTFLSVAEPAFQRSHCFEYAGVEDQGGARRIRVDFRPAADLREADVEGSIYLDTASFQVSRVIVRFTNMERAPRADLASLSATSDYEEIAPSISIATWVETKSVLKSGKNVAKLGDQSDGHVLHVRFLGPEPAGLTHRAPKPDSIATLKKPPPAR